MNVFESKVFKNHSFRILQFLNVVTYITIVFFLHHSKLYLFDDKVFLTMVFSIYVSETSHRQKL
jgi:hypothetical protein